MAEQNHFSFTMHRLAKLQPPQTGRKYYYDDTPGLAICVTAAGGKTFYSVRKIGGRNGRTVRIRLGQFPAMSIKEARDAALAVVKDIADGKDPQAERQARRKEATLAELWDQYLDFYAKPRKRTWQDDERMYKKYMTGLYTKRLSAITKNLVAKWHGQIARDHGPFQANRCKALLATMFSKSGAAVGYVGMNPCKGVENFPERSRERFLLPAEMQAFFTALATEDHYWQGFFLLCLFTGSRRGNVASMAWKEIDLENAVWHLPSEKTKNKRPTSVPLCAPALAILETRFLQRSTDNPWVFPASKGRGAGHLFDPRKAWVRILDAAKIDDLRIHDLRRSQGSWQAAMGISMAIVGKTLGHADLKSTQIYSRLELASVKDAVARVSTAMLTAGNVMVEGDSVKIIAAASQPVDEEASNAEGNEANDAGEPVNDQDQAADDC